MHVLACGTLPPGRRRKGKIEMYDRDRFFCVTGRHLAGTPTKVEVRTDLLVALHRRIFRGSDAPTPRPTRRPTVCPTDAEIIDRARRARNGERFARLWRGAAGGYASASEADLALSSMLAWYTDDAEQIGRLVAQSGLARAKWERPDYRGRTVAAALASVGAKRVTQDARSDAFDALVVRELGL